MYLVVRFWVFVVTYSRMQEVRHVAQYFYVIALLDALCCFYEAREIVLCKLVSLALTAAMIVYMSIVFAWFITDFTENALGLLILDIARALIYLLFSLLDYLHYGTGLKVLYEVDR
eukprot:jgi/Antlo1/1292/787